MTKEGPDPEFYKQVAEAGSDKNVSFKWFIILLMSKLKIFFYRFIFYESWKFDWGFKFCAFFNNVLVAVMCIESLDD